ncbi:hypothetical protein BGZ60DRAFT_401326 [Tricladium varicosporioides]|nr:hypothetical protein BGZ60DRAFT_401326 [Hymenoscyphus varicosporioides]
MSLSRGLVLNFSRPPVHAPATNLPPPCGKTPHIHTLRRPSRCHTLDTAQSRPPLVPSPHKLSHSSHPYSHTHSRYTAQVSTFPRRHFQAPTSNLLPLQHLTFHQPATNLSPTCHHPVTPKLHPVLTKRAAPGLYIHLSADHPPGPTDHL